AVRAGAPRPDIGSEAAVRQAVLAARSVGFSTGPSGVHLSKLFASWGVSDTPPGRVVQATPGVPVGSLVADGQVELGFQQLSELLHVPGIEVLGLLPPDMAFITTFSAGLCPGPQAPAVATLLAFLNSAEAADAKRRHGMEPA
ncbi:MAG: substrate-binding domain-containing protein, partial [Rubrivivax sp.]